MALYVLAGALLQPGAEPLRDEPAFLAAAERLVDHGHLVDPAAMPDHRAYLWHGPGLIVVLAPLVAIDAPLAVLRLLGVFLLGGAVVLFNRLLRRDMPARSALLWTYALGLHLPTLFVLGAMQKEPLALTLVVAAMFTMTRGLSSGRRGPLVAAGLALGGLAMVRLEYGWVAIALLVVALLWWVTRPRSVAPRRLTGVAAIAVLSCVPWLIFTFNLTGQPFYWSASAGLSLFWMSPTLPGETGEWHSPARLQRDPALAPYHPLFRRLNELHPLQRDRALRQLAERNIRRDPLVYARNLAANTSRLFFVEPMRAHRPAIVVAGCLAANVPLLLGVAWAARRLWRRRRGLPPTAAAFALFAALAVAVHVPPSATPRLLVPVVPVLVWLVATAASAPAPRTAATRRPHGAPGPSAHPHRFQPPRLDHRDEPLAAASAHFDGRRESTSADYV